MVNNGEEYTEREVPVVPGIQWLRDQGYSDRAKVSSYLDTVQVHHGEDLELRLHYPCGAAVFDPRTHSRFCPAPGPSRPHSAYDDQLGI